MRLRFKHRAGGKAEFTAEPVKIIRSMADPTVAVFDGLFRCNSPWQCPRCVAGLIGPRMQFLRELMAETRKAGGACYLVTLTTSHRAYHDGQKMRQLVTRAMRRVRQGKHAQQLAAAFGITGMVRALELTHSMRNGFHPHLHELIFTNRELAAWELDSYRARLWTRWVVAIDREATKLGIVADAPTLDRGVVVSPAADDATYLAKMGLVAELLLAPAKQGRQPGHRNQWQLLHDIRAGELAKADTGVDVAIWDAFGRATRGAQYIAMSPHLRKRFTAWVTARQLALALDDGDAPPPERHGEAWEAPPAWDGLATPPTAGAVLYRVDAATWDKCVNLYPERMYALLRVAEETGPPGCDAVLDYWRGVPFPEIEVWAPPYVVERVRHWLGLVQILAPPDH
jgi:hypothetical protein